MKRITPLKGIVRWGTAALFIIAATACGEEEALRAPAPADQEVKGAKIETVKQQLEAAQLPALTQLDTYITDSLEIDEIAGGPGDANLFSFAAKPSGDPADQTDHARLPEGGPSEFIDWDDFGNDLVNHRLLDEFKSDTTSFPRKVECVAESKVLSKMDLTYIAAANNSKHAYFAVQRRDNNGDAGWYWLFTKAEPKQVLGEAPCKANEYRLKYDISGPNGGTGDVLLVGHFKPSEGPLVRVFHAARNATDVPAGGAIDFESDLWIEDTVNPLTGAVNTTPAAPGALGSAGVNALDGPNLQPELFAEAAIPLSIFTGQSLCGASYFGSVITRPSGSGGTSPDLKDLAGPAIFNFGSAEAEATLASTCDQRIRYDVTKVLGLDGAPVPEGAYTCSWKFFHATSGDLVAEKTGCDGLLGAAPGDYRAEATVTLGGPLACADTVAVDAVTVYAPLTATAQAAPTCESKALYYGTVAGGSGDYGTLWEFFADGCPECTATPQTLADQLWSEAAPGSFDVAPTNVEYTAKLLVTDNRSDAVDENGAPATCTTETTAAAKPLAPLTVSLKLTAAGQQCPANGGPVMTTDAVTYRAIPSGGDGAHTLDWLQDSCDGQVECTINPSNDDFCHDQSVQVVLDDGSDLCDPVESETETYSKKTIVTATDN